MSNEQLTIIHCQLIRAKAPKAPIETTIAPLITKG